MPWLLLAVALTAAEPMTFYPGVGPELAVLEADSTVGGMPVRRTGYLLARADDPEALRAHPDVAELEVLRGSGHVVRIRPRPGRDEFALSRALRERADVAWSHPDLILPMVPHALPDDPYVDGQWHLANTGQSGWTEGVDIDALDAWDVTTGDGALVAVIDSGVETDHADLDVIPGWDYVAGDEDPNPDLGSDEGRHGTSVAGIAAAIGDNGTGVAGVAYGGSVYAVRLLGFNTSTADVHDAFVEAVDAGAWVLNNSWGFGDDCPEIEPYAVFIEAMEYAESVGRAGYGTAIVASAGNGNCDIGNDGFQAQPQVISVAAADGDDHREGYSSFGVHVDVTAPTNLLTTDLSGSTYGYGAYNGDHDYTGSFGGTSGAAPVVSGTLALMFAANPRLTAADARDVLCETAVRVDLGDGEYDDDGWSPYYGCGRIDAGAAVHAVADLGGPETPTILAPEGDPWVEHVLLRWTESSDPDGDLVTYDVTWWLAHDQDSATTVTTTATHLDLTGEVNAGTTVGFYVEAVDPWGPSEPSEIVTFLVQKWMPPEEEEPEEEEGEGCQAGGGAAAAVLVCFVTLSRRRWRDRLARS